MKKIFITFLLFLLTNVNVYSIEPDVFVQSTVNRASEILSKNITKDEKIEKLKSIAKETVDIPGVGFYSLGSARKGLDDNQKSITFALRFHSSEKTLNENEVNEVFEEIVKRVENDTSYSLRA